MHYKSRGVNAGHVTVAVVVVWGGFVVLLFRLTFAVIQIICKRSEAKSNTTGRWEFVIVIKRGGITPSAWRIWHKKNSVPYFLCAVL
jgi:hypothetical protein